MTSNLIFRPFSGETDLPGIADILNASYMADGISERVTAEELGNIYAHPVNWDPQKDLVLVEVEKTLVGCGSTEWREDDNGDFLHLIKISLGKEWRGKGLEKVLQSYLEHHASLAAAGNHDYTRHWFVCNVPDTWQTQIGTLCASGYTPWHFYYEMQRPLDENLPEVTFPVGLVLRPALPEHFRIIWEAGEECFRDQQDHVAPNEENFHAWITTPNLDPRLWVVVWDGDQIAGAAINVIHQGTWGETDDLFVRRPWRKQGVGRALLLSCLHLFKARGLTTAGLGVDAENGSGALGLYENLGYRPYQRVVSYRKLM